MKKIKTDVVKFANTALSNGAGMTRFCNTCNSNTCLQNYNHNQADKKQKIDIEKIYYNFPYVSTVAQIKNTLLWINGLNIIIKDENKQDLATEIEQLLNAENKEGQSIIEVLQQMTLDTIVYGKSLSFYYNVNSKDTSKIAVTTIKTAEDLRLQYISPNRYQKIVNTDDTTGIKSITSYIINKKGTADNNILISQIDSPDRSKISSNFIAYVPSEVLEFVLNPKSESPLVYNNDMVSLILSIIDDNKKVVNNESNIKLIMFSQNEINPEIAGMSAEEINNPDARSEFNKKVQETMLQIAKGLVNTLSGSENKSAVHILNNGIVTSEGMQFVDKGYNSYEYMEIVKSMSAQIACSFFGIQPAVIGASETTYASNVEPAIAFTIEKTIQPAQKLFEVQLKKLSDIYSKMYNTEIKLEFGRTDTTDPAEVASVQKTIAETANIMIRSNVGVTDALEYIKNSGVNIDTEAGDRLYIDTGVMLSETEPRSLQDDESQDIE